MTPLRHPAPARIVGIARDARFGPPMEAPMLRKFATVAALAAALTLSGCGYNTLQSQDEQVKAGWSEVVNQYQRRADLVPNLVNTVKGYAAQEREVLEAVTNARANVAGIKATPELLNDPAAFQKFQQAQGQLSGALSRLLLVVENYPNLKSDALFRDLQSQLEGTENRITVARNRYIKTVQDFNTTVRSFPTNLTAMLFKMDVKPNFTVENEAVIAKPPTVDFGKTPAAPAPEKKSELPAVDGKTAAVADPAADLMKKGY
jgi:LemA protein